MLCIFRYQVLYMLSPNFSESIILVSFVFIISQNCFKDCNMTITNVKKLNYFLFLIRLNEMGVMPKYEAM